jgi:hypothetical protein
MDFTSISTALGISPVLLILIVIWTVIWKGLALWKSARLGNKGWFVVLLIVNTLGLLEILYLFIFSEMERRKKSEKKKN